MNILRILAQGGSIRHVLRGSEALGGSICLVLRVSEAPGDSFVRVLNVGDALGGSRVCPPFSSCLNSSVENGGRSRMNPHVI